MFGVKTYFPSDLKGATNDFNIMFLGFKQVFFNFLGFIDNVFQFKGRDRQEVIKIRF